MNQRPPEQRIEEQIADAVRYLPLRQKVLLLRLALRIQDNKHDESWGWALYLDTEDGGNGKCTS